MHARRLTTWMLFAIASFSTAPLVAQTTAGSGTVVVLPLASNISGAYATTVFVRNPNPNAITLNVRYYQSDSANPPGNGSPYACGTLTVPANLALTFDLAAQCTFPGPGVDNFGQLVLEDATSTYKTNTFFAYSRTQDPTGNGFSVEGFPIGNFSGAQAHALGLKKTFAAPHYESNCFVGALGEAVSYQLRLWQGETATPIGSPISGTLQPFHTTRILHVFAAAGVANPDYSNVRATFDNSATSSMIAFCTVETTDNGSADFRIAKSDAANDNRQSRLACYGMDSCGDPGPSATNPAQITDVSKKNIHYLILDQPDFVKCDLVATSPANLGGLEIMLRGPGDPLTAPQFVLPAGYNAPPYTSGGVAQTGFYIYTGEKSTIASGATTRWYIDVSYRQGSGVSVPINYGIKCASGNGVTVPWLGTTGPANP